MKSTIAFIGGGNMASSLVGGLVAASTPPQQILVADTDAGRCARLQQQFAVNTTGDNAEAVSRDVIVLAVKPNVLQPVCRQLSTSLSGSAPLFISVAAGVRSDDIARWLGGNRAIVRCMPNTPALLQCGATGLYASEQVSAEQKQTAQQIMQAVGITVWLEDENLLDAVTALSGSGPAYFFLMMEAMQQAGEQLGLDSNTAATLTTQTALGAARMAIDSNSAPATLRAGVTSKGGTTESAITSFELAEFNQLVLNAIRAAYHRSKTIAEELGKDDHGP